MKVLIVEDNADSRTLLMKQLHTLGCEVVSAVNGAEALAQALVEPPDVIISDIMMPKMDGFQLCHEWKQIDKLKAIPFIFYTATYTKEEDKKFAMSLGGVAFVTKPTEPDIMIKILRDAIAKAKSEALVPPEVIPGEPASFLSEHNKRIFAKLEEKVAELELETEQRKRSEEALRQSHAKLSKALQDIIRAMALTCELRDPFTAGHQLRVTQLSSAIAEEMNLSADQKGGLRIAAAIHDIGKMSVPTEILSKAGKLLDIEFKLVKMHAQAGHDILETIDFDWPVAKIIQQHHERLNGTGYPLGLAGDNIMIEARILAVADVVEAMSSHRPYRAALGIDKALAEITAQRNVLYDGGVVDACLKVFKVKHFKFE